ncbi:universal stress protein [Haloarcula nitratireducens]|uniref:Universal stress protein n=1 Tax=Haloarcula nitratireducens TaxID=2487749 RepID=A0AAW4P9F1_9EURY|nr:universal stress protein [Halomicroarcula nitratireducens]MBX0294511.1 universal stress protein [Halomicroarcula nitratireducens]
MYDRILVPTDGSAGMGGVVRHAVELAAFHDAEIHGLYVVETGRYSTLPVKTGWENLTEMLREEGETALDDLRERTGDVAVETVTRDGVPSTAIVEYALDADCDAIVMGTHGRGGIDRLLLGSVAERVVRASPVPVTTVPVSDHEMTAPTDETEARAPE